jgi:hypothetical protein
MSASSDKAALSAKRRRRFVETDEYRAFLRRAIRAYGRRVADGDVEALPGLLNLSAELDQAIGCAVTGLRQHGYSWTEIANPIGVTRQAARQRWGGECP